MNNFLHCLGYANLMLSVLNDFTNKKARLTGTNYMNAASLYIYPLLALCYTNALTRACLTAGQEFQFLGTFSPVEHKLQC
jgi:hypothetical protein